MFLHLFYNLRNLRGWLFHHIIAGLNQCYLHIIVLTNNNYFDYRSWLLISVFAKECWMLLLLCLSVSLLVWIHFQSLSHTSDWVSDTIITRDAKASNNSPSFLKTFVSSSNRKGWLGPSSFGYTWSCKISENNVKNG